MKVVRESKVDRDSTQIVNMHGRRTTGGCKSVDKTDYIIQQELTDAVKALSDRIAALETAAGS